MPELDHWLPEKGIHAIQQVNVVISFSQAVTDIPWRKIESLSRSVARKLELSVENPITQLSFQAAMASSGQFKMGPQPNSEKIGLEFIRFIRPDFYAEKAGFDRQSIFYENWDYSRWAVVRSKVAQICESVLSNYINSVPLASITLEYIDQFRAKKLNFEAPCDEVLEPNSALFSRAAFKPTDPWHLHSGWFADLREDVRRIFNVNVNVGDMVPAQAATGPLAQLFGTGGGRTRAIQIRTAISDLFNQTGKKPVEESDLTTAFAASHLDEMHLDLKRLMGDILTAKAQQRINLFPENET